MKTAVFLVCVCFAGLFYWWIRTPEIQWYAARSLDWEKGDCCWPGHPRHLGLQYRNNDLGIPNCESAASNWQSSLHVTVPRNILGREWTQKDLEKGTVMKWTGRVEIGVGNSVWLNVPPQL